jgi:hypothetical protein
MSTADWAAQSVVILTKILSASIPAIESALYGADYRCEFCKGVLGVPAKFRKATISSVMSLRLSVRPFVYMEQPAPTAKIFIKF